MGLATTPGRPRAHVDRHTERDPWMPTSVSEAGLRGAAVGLQQSAESFAALDLALVLVDLSIGLDQLVAQPLMVSFAVIVGDVSGNGSPQRCLTEEEHFQ